MPALTIFLTELWHLVDVLTGVPSVGHAEAEIKIKHLEYSVPKVMSLNHPEVLDRLVSNSELNPAYCNEFNTIVIRNIRDWYIKKTNKCKYS